MKPYFDKIMKITLRNHIFNNNFIFYVKKKLIYFNMHTIHVCKFIAGYVLVYMQICNVFIVNNIVDMILKKNGLPNWTYKSERKP